MQGHRSEGGQAPNHSSRAHQTRTNSCSRVLVNIPSEMRMSMRNNKSVRGTVSKKRSITLHQYSAQRRDMSTARILISAPDILHAQHHISMMRNVTINSSPTKTPPILLFLSVSPQHTIPRSLRPVPTMAASASSTPRIPPLTSTHHTSPSTHTPTRPWTLPSHPMTASWQRQAATRRSASRT